MIRHGIHKDAIVDSQGDCNLPDSTIIEPGCIFYVGPQGRVQLGARNIFHTNASLRVDQGWLVTGNDVSFGPGCQIYNPWAGVEIGHRCLIGGGVLICGVNHDQMRTNVPIQQPDKNLPIQIENDVFIGMGVIILPGVTIGMGAVVDAGSVVTQNIPRDAVACGTPCKVYRIRHGTGLFTTTREGSIRLHLGCGPRHIPGFFHLDAQPYPHVDLITDVANLEAIPNETADLIYASHVLEHFGRWEFREVLAEWRRVLKPGGLLRLAVPNFAACAKLYYEQGLADGLNGLMGLICGGQRDPYDFHKMIFDEPFLTHELLGIGFRQVRRWDWRTTDHTTVDDYSQAYLPHMDKEYGTLTSLNLEAIR